MDDLLNKLGWKKVAVLMVVVSLVGIVFVILSFIATEKPKSKIASDSISPDKNYEVAKTQKDNNNALGQNLKTYITPFYQISYPENFEAVLYRVSGNIVSNVKLKDKISGNQIEITVFSSGPVTAESLAEPYLLASYTKTQINVNSLKGFELANLGKKVKINDRIAIISKGAVLIRLQLTYGGARNEALEDQFSSIIQTLK